ncbi:MAG TPA: heavy metal-responsive transcriptional regulator [Actinomycetota bacterium]|nr:heavy metal-responsive transcriptional regulator [Actinomycetota bacterium]
MRIGEVAGRAGVSAKTIRYYEGAGLLVPPPRTASGYRDYGEDAVGRLRFIRAAQSIGLSLGEIREVLAFRERGDRPCHHVAALIERHAVELGERITELEGMRRELERLSRQARIAPSGDAAYCHILEAAWDRPARPSR